MSQLGFGPDLRVRRLMFDGATVASARHLDGRLSELSRPGPDGTGIRRQNFDYGPGDRLAGVRLDGGPVAGYEYDGTGRVVGAMDSSFDGAERSYRYTARGDLNGLSAGDADLGFRTNPLGLIEQVSWDGDNAIQIAYNDADRVGSLRFDLGDDSLNARYRHDRAGFRVIGHYDVLEPLGNAQVALEYDSAGNLVRIELPGPDGGTRITEHTLGSENELLSVTPLSAPTFEQTFEYDGSGRAVRSAQGNGRVATFRYDPLGRLADVYLDGEHVLTSDHGPMDPDPVHATDARTPFTATADPIAPAVFGSLDEIVHTRPYGTPYGFARFVQEMGRFVVADQAVVPPDALMLASLRRRNMGAEATPDPSPLQGFDKLSSSLFLPPEYFSSNCAFCVGGVVGFEIERIGSGPVTPGQTVTFVADGSWEYCDFYFYGDEGVHIQTAGVIPGVSAQALTSSQVPTAQIQTAGIIPGIPYPFTHYVDFVGGSGDGVYSTNSARLQFSGSFSSPGTKTVRDTLSCGCGGIFLGLDEESVCVEPPSLPPIDSVPPAPTYVSLINNGNSWGLTNILYDDTLHCSALCDDSYRLDGSISVTPSSYVRVSNQVAAVDTCSVSTRTAANIAHTRIHELVHANALVGVINSFKAPIGTEYGSLSACATALDSLQAGLDAAYAAEFNRQKNHLDHAGERRHFKYCPNPNGLAKEGVCGLVSGYDCPDPPGDRYPGL